MKLRTIPYTGTRFTKGLLFRMMGEPDHEHIDLHTYADTEPGPLVITLRDPLLSRISSRERGNPESAYPVWLWRQVFRSTARSDVHLVRIDQPRSDERERLEEFVGGVVAGDSRWLPIGQSDKPSEERRRYAEGYLSESLQEDVRVLEQIGANQFFREHGYSLPWMSSSGRRLRLPIMEEAV